MRELIDKVTQLVAEDLSSRSVDSIVSEIAPLTRGLQVKVPHFQPGIMLFRGRLGQRCNHVRDLSYPPSSFVKLGRVNRESSPIFYGTTLRSVVFFEVPNNVGDEILVSRWRTSDRLLVNHLGYTEPVFRDLNSGRTKASWDGISNPIDGDTVSREALEILGRLFARRDDGLYKLTAALGELFMRPPLKGLIYPTIAMSANADNFALRPEWVDRGLHFIGVELVRIDAVRGMERDVTVIDYATAKSGGALGWKGRGPSWQLIEKEQQLRFSTEQGVWVARDETGNMVDPA